tara:strand:+ start:8516 stop:8665 length:150 start_codon:yes stop_codon:yes gene_type:complete
MVKKENEDILKRLFDEEYLAARKRWPDLSEEQIYKFAEFFARLRFEEQE